MIKWEYAYLYDAYEMNDPHHTIDILNREGSLGWELVSIQFNENSFTAVFKREKKTSDKQSGFSVPGYKVVMGV